MCGMEWRRRGVFIEGGRGEGEGLTAVSADRSHVARPAQRERGGSLADDGRFRGSPP